MKMMDREKVKVFQVRQLVQLEDIANELRQKYSSNPDVELTINTLKFAIDRLSTRDTYHLYRYLRDLHAAKEKYREFSRLFPTFDEVKELLS